MAAIKILLIKDDERLLRFLVMYLINGEKYIRNLEDTARKWHFPVNEAEKIMSFCKVNKIIEGGKIDEHVK